MWIIIFLDDVRAKHDGAITKLVRAAVFELDPNCRLRYINFNNVFGLGDPTNHLPSAWEKLKMSEIWHKNTPKL